MKLIFPNGEHEAFELVEGVTRIGSSGEAQLVLSAPSIAPLHGEIVRRGDNAEVRPVDAVAAVVLNGRQIQQASPLKPGDLLLFGRIGCRVVAVERAAPALARPAPVDDDGRTRMRMALPKFMLRGVSGTTFGKTFAVAGTMTIGRQSDCDIAIPAEEVSRHHARLQVTAEGLLVEDLGSANGTWINDKRVQSGLLRPGEELRLDTVRFLLQAPGAAAPTTRAEAPPEPSRRGLPMGWIVAGALVVLAVAAFALHHFGMF